MKKLVIAMLIWPLVAVGLCATGEEPSIVETRVKRVALFKNGYSFLTCEGELPEGEGSVLLDRIPRASLGTLWFDTPVARTRAVRRGFSTERVAASFREMAQANPGATVRVVTDEEIVGTLLDVPGPAPNQPPLLGRNMGGYASSSSMGMGVPSDMLMVRRSDGGVTAIRFGDVRRIEFPDECATHYDVVQEKRFIECELDGATGETPLRLHYLEAGMTWTPGYEVTLLDDATALVRLKATLINDIEDLEEVEVRFVVGYPNFMYADVIEPLTADQPVQAFLEALCAPESGRRSSRRATMTQQSGPSIMTNAPYFGEGYADAPPPMPAVGEFREDLFFYPPFTTTIKKGERTAFAVMETQAPYRHIYTWDVPDTIPVNRQGYYQEPSEDGPESEVIWHGIRLKNPSKQPWTTGSALILQDELPIGQDMLRYTSIGGQTIVRITRATDVAGQKKETEIERQHDAKRMYGTTYDLVKVRGELTLQNRRTEPIHAVVKKSTTGTVTDSSPEAEVTVRAEGLRPVNQKSTLEWEVDLNPGEETVLTYAIDVYVRG